MKKQRIFAMILAIMLVLSSMTFVSAAAGEYVPLDAKGDVYQVPHAKSEINVDGVIGESEWANAAQTRSLTDMTTWMGGPALGEGTKGYFMWDEDNLYFAFEFKEYTYLGTEYVTLIFKGDSGDVTVTADVASSSVKLNDGKIADMATTHTENSITMEFTVPTTVLTPEDIVWDAVEEDGYFFCCVWFGGTAEGSTPMHFMSSTGGFGADTFVLCGLEAGAPGFVPSVAHTIGSWKIPKSQSVAFADGILESQEWANALEIDVLANSCFMNDSWAKPGAGSKYLMMYDDTNLYIALVYTYSSNFTAEEAANTNFQFSIPNAEIDINNLSEGDEGWNPGWLADINRYTISVDKNSDVVKYKSVKLPGASFGRVIGEGALVEEVVIPREQLNLKTEEGGQYYLGFFQINDGGNLVMLPNANDPAAPYSNWTTGNVSTFILSNKKAGTEGWEHVVVEEPEEPSEFVTPAASTGSVFGIRKAAVSPVIDGNITAKEWYNALVVDISGDNNEIHWYMNGDQHRTFGEGSSVSMLWDENYIYYAFDLKYNADWTSEGALGDNEHIEFRLNATADGGEGGFYTIRLTPAAGTCVVGDTAVEGVQFAKETTDSYKIEIALPISAFASYVNGGAVDNGYFYMQIRGAVPSFWVMANTCDQGSFGGAKNTYVLSPLAGGAVAPAIDELPIATAPIVADGIIGNVEWDNANNLPITNELWEHILSDTFSLGENAFIKTMYDVDNLYVAFDLDDVPTEGKDDILQFFLCPTGDPSESNCMTAGMLQFKQDGSKDISNVNFASPEAKQAVLDLITYVLDGDDYMKGEIVIPWSFFRAVDEVLTATKGFTIENQYVTGETIYWAYAIQDNSADGCWWGMYQPINGGNWSQRTAAHKLTAIPAGGVEPEVPVADIPEINATPSVDHVAAGEEFTVDVSIKNNPGIIDLKFNVEYDASKFEIVSIANGKLFTTLVDSFDATNGGAFTGTVRVYSALSDADITEDGILVTITVKALQDAEAGDGIFTFDAVEAWSSPESTTAVVGIEVDTTDWVAGTATVTVDQHTHSLTKHDRVEPTCTKVGNIEYWECECGKYFSDEAGVNEITLEDTVLNTIDHSYETKYDETGHWTECSVCHDKTEVVAHEYGEWVVIVDAWIGSKGVKRHTCTCGYYEDADVSESFLGDIDGNDSVDEADAIALARYLVGWNVEITEALADVDGDGRITDWDSIVIERWLAGWYTA